MKRGAGETPVIALCTRRSQCGSAIMVRGYDMSIFDPKNRPDPAFIRSIPARGDPAPGTTLDLEHGCWLEVHGYAVLLHRRHEGTVVRCAYAWYEIDWDVPNLLLISEIMDPGLTLHHLVADHAVYLAFSALPIDVLRGKPAFYLAHVFNERIRRVLLDLRARVRVDPGDEVARARIIRIEDSANDALSNAARTVVVTLWRELNWDYSAFFTSEGPRAFTPEYFEDRFLWVYHSVREYGVDYGIVARGEHGNWLRKQGKELALRLQKSLQHVYEKHRESITFQVVTSHK